VHLLLSLHNIGQSRDHVDRRLQFLYPVAFHARAVDRDGERRRRAIHHAAAPSNFPAQLRTVPRTDRTLRSRIARNSRTHCPPRDRRNISSATVAAPL